MSETHRRSEFTLQMDEERVSIGEGDNWPFTWTDGDELFGFYNDGRGFDPDLEASRGSAPVVIDGRPPEIRGRNIESPTGTIFSPHDRENPKASGLVMVDGILYCFLRNLNPPGLPAGCGSSLIYSNDHGATWPRVPWVWREIGYPVWLNAGRNYGASKDEYAYFISPDGPSAYADYRDIVLGRVPRDEMLDETAYEFFAGILGTGSPSWGPHEHRRPVFSDPRGCFRPEIVYSPGIGRYLLLLSSPPTDWEWWFEPNPDRSSRLAVYEGRNPWGPWNEIICDPTWCESEDRFQPRVPAKWISSDGLSFWLAYSCIPRGPYKLNLQRCALISRAGGTA